MLPVYKLSKREALLLQRDHATRFVSRNPVNWCTNIDEKLEIQEWPSNTPKIITNAAIRQAVYHFLSTNNSDFLPGMLHMDSY